MNEENAVLIELIKSATNIITASITGPMTGTQVIDVEDVASRDAIKEANQMLARMYKGVGPVQE